MVVVMAVGVIVSVAVSVIAIATTLLIVPVHMHVLMAATAMVLLAQPADVLRGLPALGHLVDHIGLHSVATHGEHGAAQERVHTGVLAQRADREIG